MIYHLKKTVYPLLIVIGSWTLSLAIDPRPITMLSKACQQMSFKLQKLIPHEGIYEDGQLQGQFAREACFIPCMTEMAKYRKSRLEAHTNADLCNAGDDVCYCLDKLSPGSLPEQKIPVGTKASDGVNYGYGSLGGAAFMGVMPPYTFPWPTIVNMPRTFSTTTSGVSTSRFSFPFAVPIAMAPALRNSNKGKSKQQQFPKQTVQTSFQVIQCRCSMQVEYLKLHIQDDLDLQLGHPQAEPICDPIKIAARHQIDGWELLSHNRPGTWPLAESYSCNTTDPTPDRRFCHIPEFAWQCIPLALPTQSKPSRLLVEAFL
ncbi:hypothetical protein BCR37DRAFT_168415 [Protomyces lactucae-debilis]|uniref:Uncharacterized protein n=1 Tax=Protomyces lactucae-debilis TaxID=2754530 RepID=A0A1Y2EWU0_PROLT|nr:uncharacterized protein BCR37DRAFT_168415 [Protomyces lactucae-debilis]ORY76081.1 hypothetical protein BCR37DRAFT_168415 [Protomyces lactucae-debilis]